MKVSLIAALSADSYIAPQNNEDQPSTSWTSPEDTAWFNRKTKEIGTVIMGRTTWESIPPKHRPLSDRTNIVYSTSLEFLAKNEFQILDENSKFEIRNSKLSYQCQLTPPKLINLLESQKVAEIAVIGGTSIYTLFMKAKLVDTLYLTIEPIFFGSGIPLFDKSMSTKLQLDSVEHLNQSTLLLTYQVNK